MNNSAEDKKSVPDGKQEQPSDGLSYTESLVSFWKEGSSISEHISKLQSERSDSFDVLEEGRSSIEEITSKFKAIIKKVTDPKEKASLLSDMNKIIHKVKAKAYDSEFIRKRDKLAYVFFTLRLILGTYLLGRWPCYYPWFHVISALIMIPARFIYFRSLRYHYFLLDFCYWANLIIVLYLSVYSDNQVLYNVAMAFSAGPLLASVPIFNNAIVFHSLDKITSNFIHLSPSVAMWSLRTATCSANTEPLPFFDYYFYAITFYSVWVIPYTLIVFKFTFERCKRKENLTLYSWMMEDKESNYYNYGGKFGEKYRPLMFVSHHAIVNVFLLGVAYLALTHFYIHTAFIGVILLSSLWNAANYYIEFFSRKYVSDLEKLEALKAKLE